MVKCAPGNVRYLRQFGENILTWSFIARDPTRTSQPPLRASTCQSAIAPFRPNGVTAYLSNRDALESGRSFYPFQRSMHRYSGRAFDNRFKTKRAIAAGV